MSDYIDKWELIEKMEWDNDIEKWTIWEDDLKSIPSANVEPVRHGRWIEDERTYPGPGLKNNLCSACGEVAGAWKEGLEPGRKWAYCPNCGALMDGKEDGHEAD